MNIYLQLLLLAAIVVYVVDLSGFSQTVLDIASRVKGRRISSLKPLTCSLCMTWWCGLAWAWLQGALSLQVVAYIAGLSFFSLTLYELLIFIATIVSVTLFTRVLGLSIFLSYLFCYLLTIFPLFYMIKGVGLVYGAQTSDEDDL